MIYLENVSREIQHTLNRYDQVWFIMRDASEEQYFIVTHSQIVVHAELSPKLELFRLYRDRTKSSYWDKFAFNNFYVPHFLKGLSENQAGLLLLQELKTQSAEHEIALACFCEDESMCHRSIIGGILLNMGATIACPELYKVYSLGKESSLNCS